MLKRKIEPVIERHLRGRSGKALVVAGARQVGKSYIIRHCAASIFKNVVEINLIKDAEGPQIFSKVNTVNDFYFALSAYHGKPLGKPSDTLVFLDEIQQYPALLTLLKFLREDNRYSYAASGSLLGVTLKKSASVPLGSIDIVNMYPLDFEEFLWANDFGEEAIAHLKDLFAERKDIPEGIHNQLMDIYKRYLLAGGLPEAVNKYLETRDLIQVREVQNTIMNLYKIDASQYDKQNSLKISRIYDLIPSNMENKKKRLVFKNIEERKGKRSSDYEDEIEYLISSGIALGVHAISNPKFPLAETEPKNLIKLYLNDPGLLTLKLYRDNPIPVLHSESGINLGSVYECAVACQLAANDNSLFYYDNRQRGEVDFIIDDFKDLTVIPLEVKSGKDYKIHSAISRMVATEDYHIKQGYVLSNNREISMHKSEKITYAPIYCSMFFDNRLQRNGPVII